MGFISKASLLAALPLAFGQYTNNTRGSDLTNATSPPSYPAPWIEGLGDWEQAYQQAQEFVSQLTLLEKVNLTTGVGWQGEKCVGETGGIPRLGFRALCLQDSPLGVRFADFVSAFPAGVTIAATWDRTLFYQRGYNMGQEQRDKGTGRLSSLETSISVCTN